MQWQLLRILVAVTACSTVVAGIPAASASPTAAARRAGSIASVPADGDTAAESRDAASGEEREEESDPRVHQLAGRTGSDWPALGSHRRARFRGLDARPAKRPSAVSIRGPPAA